MSRDKAIDIFGLTVVKKAEQIESELWSLNRTIIIQTLCKAEQIMKEELNDIT
jgi:hypothetical protein